MALEKLLHKLSRDRWLTTGEYAALLSVPMVREARLLADRVRRERFGTRVWLRGLIDVGSICRFDCPHCHQRTGADCVRYRMRPREILDCCDEAEALDMRSILLRTSPDRFYTEKMLTGLIGKIRSHFPDFAVGLALGEQSRESLTALADMGADRYTLLHETADRERFLRTHPPELSHDRRLHCLNELKELGFQTACGFLVGDQSPEELAKELKFLEEFQPHAVELLPMDAPPEQVEYLISLIRLLLPESMIAAPANTPGQDLARGVRRGGEHPGPDPGRCQPGDPEPHPHPAQLPLLRRQPWRRTCHRRIHRHPPPIPGGDRLRGHNGPRPLVTMTGQWPVTIRSGGLVNEWHPLGSLDWSL